MTKTANELDEQLSVASATKLGLQGVVVFLPNRADLWSEKEARFTARLPKPQVAEIDASTYGSRNSAIAALLWYALAELKKSGQTLFDDQKLLDRVRVNKKNDHLVAVMPQRVDLGDEERFSARLPISQVKELERLTYGSRNAAISRLLDFAMESLRAAKEVIQVAPEKRLEAANKKRA